MDRSDKQWLIPTQRDSSDPPPRYDQSQVVKVIIESSDMEYVSNVSTDTESKPVSNLPKELKAIVSPPCNDRWNSHYLHNPCETRCPHCQTDVWPQVEYKRGFLPWLVCCFVLMTCIFAVFAPYVLLDRGLQDIIHWCPVCNREIRRMTKL